MSKRKPQSVVPKNAKWEVMTYTWKPKGKMKKQVQEYFQSEEHQKTIRTVHLKEVIIYLEGIMNGKGNILPLGKSHLESLWRIHSELK